MKDILEKKQHGIDFEDVYAKLKESRRKRDVFVKE